MFTRAVKARTFAAMTGFDEDHETAAKARKERRDDLGDRVAVVREDIDALEAQVIADRKVIEHLQAEGFVDREKIANLEAALVTARRIGAAMGILMLGRGITDVQAFDLLRSQSQATQRKLRAVAEEVILTGTLDA